MGCIHISNKSRITIRVMYYIDIFNQSVIWSVQGDPSFATFKG